jgi:hypothetical protein
MQPKDAVSAAFLFTLPIGLLPNRSMRYGPERMRPATNITEFFAPERNNQKNRMLGPRTRPSHDNG